MSRPVTLVLADDHAPARMSVAEQLARAPTVRLVAHVRTTDDAINAAIESKPDVVLLDLEIPGVLAFEAARTIKARSADTKVGFLGNNMRDRAIQAALDAGAMAIVSKREPAEAIVQAVQRAAHGQAFYSKEVEARLALGAGGVMEGKPMSRGSTLTPRELEVLRHLAEGHSKKEIAKTLHLSVKTIENHAANIMNRLDIHDRVGLARFAIREGIAEA